MTLNTHKLTKLEYKIRMALLWLPMSLYVWVTLTDSGYRLPAALPNPLTFSVLFHKHVCNNLDIFSLH